MTDFSVKLSGTEGNKVFNLENIYKLLMEGFDDKELRRFCQHRPEFKDFYETLPSIILKDQLVDGLIEFADNRVLFEFVLAWAEGENGAKFEMFKPYYVVGEDDMAKVGDVKGGAESIDVFGGFKRSIVRIYGKGGHVVGGGVRIGSKRVLTCKHVLNSALGVTEGVDIMGKEVWLDFPLTDKDEGVTGKVVFWQGVDKGDVALLVLDRVPDEAVVVDFKPTDDVWGHEFRAYGFTLREGGWARGDILDEQSEGLMQLEGIRTTGYAIDRGFSGAPVWDNDLKGVVGIIVVRDRDIKTKVAYLIPTRKLVGWEELGVKVDLGEDFEKFEINEDTIEEIQQVTMKNKSPFSETTLWNKKITGAPSSFCAGTNYICLALDKKLYFLSSKTGLALGDPLDKIGEFLLADYFINDNLIINNKILILTLIPRDSIPPPQAQVVFVSVDEHSDNKLSIKWSYPAPSNHISRLYIYDKKICFIEDEANFVFLDLTLKKVNKKQLPKSELFEASKLHILNCVSFVFINKYLYLATCNGTIQVIDMGIETPKVLETLYEHEYQWGLAPLATNGKYLFFASPREGKSSLETNFYTVDINTKETTTIFTFDAEVKRGIHRGVTGKPLLVDNYLYVVSHNHFLYVVDVESYTIIHRYEMPHRIELGAIACKDSIIVVDASGQIKAIPHHFNISSDIDEELMVPKEIDSDEQLTYFEDVTFEDVTFEDVTFEEINSMNPDEFLKIDENDVVNLIKFLDTYSGLIGDGLARRNFLKNAHVNLKYLNNVNIDGLVNSFISGLVSNFQDYKVSLKNMGYHPLVKLIEYILNMQDRYPLDDQDRNFLETIFERGQENLKAWKIAHAIGIIESANNTQIGTGVLIEGKFVLTCKHIFTKHNLTKAWIRFGYKKTASGDTRQGYRYELDLDYVNHNHKPDYAVLKIKGRLIKDLYACRQKLKPIRLGNGQKVRILHYPQSNPLVISKLGEIVRVGEYFIGYNIDGVVGGSSGGAVFTTNWELVAIHSGYPSHKKYPDKNTTEGVPIRAICTDYSEICDD